MQKKEDELKAVFHQATMLQGEKTDGEKRMAQRVTQLDGELAALHRRCQQDAARSNDLAAKLAAAKSLAEQDAARRVDEALDGRRRAEAELRAARAGTADRDALIEKQKRMLIDAEQTILVKDSTIARLELRLNAARDSHDTSTSLALSGKQEDETQTWSSFTSGDPLARARARGDESVAQLRSTVDDLRAKFSVRAASASPVKDDVHVHDVASRSSKSSA